jgi:structural maintenance of chromosome 1
LQKEICSEFEDRIKELEGQLDKLAPNMRASEHMADVSSRLDELDREAEVARERAKKASEAFESVKEERQRRFNECFAHVADKINDIYKRLTQSENYAMGGTAYLSVEQQDEPYLAGVKFNAMPPTKRFRDMEQLSGGERTVAALALLFAIHDYKPSPFFILDEVDAALDPGNVSRVSAYIQSRAHELQMIIITLKDAFFEKADALVGIYRDTAVNASRFLTLDLTPFEHAASSDQSTVALPV